MTLAVESSRFCRGGGGGKGLGVRDWGLGFRVQGLRFRV